MTHIVQSVNLTAMVIQQEHQEAALDATICATKLVPARYLCLHSHFPCGDGSCVLQHYLCDGKTDCPDDSDEIDCNRVCTFHRAVLPAHGITNCFTHCHPSNCSCHVLYYQCKVSGGCVPASILCDGTADCPDQMDELDCSDPESEQTVMSLDAETFTCNDNTLISSNQVNDLIPDCPGGSGEDEISMKLFWSGQRLNLPFALGCLSTHGHCIKGIPGVCYPRNKICVYEIDSETSQIRYCRNGAHLSNCSNHECPGMFKCPLSYCVPYHYLCDGSLDCPHGEDENNCWPLDCLGLLRCRHDNVCVHPNNVGDKETDCSLSNDDEALLEVRPCPASCQCLGDSVSCSVVNCSVINELWVSIRKLHFQSSLIDIKCSFCLQELVSLDLSNNAIRSLSFPRFCPLPQIRFLKLQSNSIQVVRRSMLRGLGRVRYFELHRNPIQTVDPFSFYDLRDLLLLNLSHLHLTQIRVNTFSGLLNLVTLDLSYNPLVRLGAGSFNPLKERLVNLLLITNSTPSDLLSVVPSLSVGANIHVYSATVCPYIEGKARCHFVENYDGRCCALIDNTIVESILWIYGSALQITNLASAMFWTFCDANKISKIFMIIINACGVGVSAYPLYLVAVHNYYKSYFLFYRESFLDTFHCRAVGVIYVWCHYTCLFVVLLTTCDQCVLVVSPLKDHRVTEKLLLYALGILVTALIVFTVLPLVLHREHAMRSMRSTNVCQILPAGAIRPYVISVLIVAEFVLHATTAIVNYVTFYQLKHSGGTLKAHGGSRLKQRASIRKSVLGSFEVACVTTACIVQVLAFALEYTGDQIIISMFGLLLYELLLPILYTFTTSSFSKALCAVISNRK